MPPPFLFQHGMNQDVASAVAAMLSGAPPPPICPPDMPLGFPPPPIPGTMPPFPPPMPGQLHYQGTYHMVTCSVLISAPSLHTADTFNYILV